MAPPPSSTRGSEGNVTGILGRVRVDTALCFIHYCVFLKCRVQALPLSPEFVKDADDRQAGDRASFIMKECLAVQPCFKCTFSDSHIGDWARKRRSPLCAFCVCHPEPGCCDVLIRWIHRCACAGRSRSSELRMPWGFGMAKELLILMGS